jgi:hypothetical protein
MPVTYLLTESARELSIESFLRSTVHIRADGIFIVSVVTTGCVILLFQAQDVKLQDF